MGLFDKFFKKPAPRDRIARQTIDLSPPGVEGNVTYNNIDFVDCDFIMSDSWPQSLTDCTFQSCRFTLEKSLWGLSTRNATFVNCDFHFKRASNWRAIHGERFESCRFTGNLTGSRFGDLKTSDDILGGDQPGYVKDCDFSRLNIDETEFHNFDEKAGNRFPGWPVIGYLCPPKGEDLPPSLQSLPDAFHDKCCTSVKRYDTVYIVNLKKLDLDRDRLKAIGEETGQILIFEN